MCGGVRECVYQETAVSLAKHTNKPDSEGVLIRTCGKGGCQGHLYFSGNELTVILKHTLFQEDTLLDKREFSKVHDSC